LTIKRYETGVISKYVHERKVGDTVLMSGPNTVGTGGRDGQEVGFVAGGTASHR